MDKVAENSGKPGAGYRPNREFHHSREMTPLWNRALERYHEELEDGDDEVLAGSRSFGELIDYARSIGLPGSESSITLNRLSPTLKFVDDFSAIVAVCLGANTRVIAFVWGSLRLIIHLAAEANDTLEQVVDMLEELSLSMPRFRYYEENLPLNRSFENSLVDLYTEVICFYARVIRHYRTNPHIRMQREGWNKFQKDYTSTIRRVKHLSSRVETQADLAKMNMDKSKYDEVISMLQNLNGHKDGQKGVTRCYYIPPTPSSRFRAREDDLRSIEQALNPEHGKKELRTFALYGMAGVGKTQLALQYALKSKEIFDVVLWIAADTVMGLDQSFREAAFSLGLNREAVDGSHEQAATARVKEWLSDPTNDLSWLLIFDNADDVATLRSAWPASGNGSVLLTSRDPAAASTVAERGLHLRPFEETVGVEVLLRLLGIEHPDDEQKQEAVRITRALGGLPLALDQVAGFIRQRKMRIQDFMRLYERNATKIDARRYEFMTYPHTLATVFEMSLDSLSGPTMHLQNLLSFLEPDVIPESIFGEGTRLSEDTDLEFLEDEMDLGDAEERLLQLSLIHKDANENSLSVHRLVQTAVLRRLNKTEKSKYFTIVVELLNPGFPDTWSKDIGHQKKEWEKCERYLPHVNTLVGFSTDTPSIASKPDAWAELLLRCSWYLYEKEQYVYAKKFTQVALQNFTNQSTLAYASATDLLGLIDLDMAAWYQALQSFEKGLSIRQRLLPPGDPLIAFALNNVALAWTEAPDLTKAADYHKQAISIRLQNNSDRIGNSYSNFAVTLLRMGKPDEADRMLMSCPSLQKCTDETFLQADNPRFVGDMVLLSRIRKAQGRSDDALRLASKALQWRQSVHGDRFKTCDSMYDVACLLQDQSKTGTAIDMLSRLISVAGTLELGEVHAARAEWKLSKILKGMNREKESAEHQEKARALRRTCRPEEDEKAMLEEQTWECLTPFMLW